MQNANDNDFTPSSRLHSKQDDLRKIKNLSQTKYQIITKQHIEHCEQKMQNWYYEVIRQYCDKNFKEIDAAKLCLNTQREMKLEIIQQSCWRISKKQKTEIIEQINTWYIELAQTSFDAACEFADRSSNAKDKRRNRKFDMLQSYNLSKYIKDKFIQQIENQYAADVRSELITINDKAKKLDMLKKTPDLIEAYRATWKVNIYCDNLLMSVPEIRILTSLQKGIARKPESLNFFVLAVKLHSLLHTDATEKLMISHLYEYSSMQGLVSGKGSRVFG